MGIIGTKPPPRQPRPASNAPGTLMQELQALLVYFSFPAFARRANPDDAHRHARDLVRQGVRR